ncbi:MAG TPA: hypothetical protein VEB21_17940 [Terriglobales bacterium]|nr:hypothetical protein [Terriglobales bacterium]
MRRGWLIAAVALLALFGVQRCQRSYARMATVHVEVLSHTATKLFSLLASGRRPDSMEEFRYPSARGREFLAEFDGDSARISYAKLSALLDRYDELVQRAADARVGGIGRADLEAMEQRRDDVLALAVDVRTELDRE